VKVKIVVEMYGGTIQSVFVDNEKVNVTDVIFTENHKYGSGVDPEFEVEEGPLEGDIIYCHHEPQLGARTCSAPNEGR